MSYTTTALGLRLPVTGSGQTWSTAVYNDNLSKLEAAIVALQKAKNVRITSGRVTHGNNIPANSFGSDRTINFPTGLFTAPPDVVAVASNSRIVCAVDVAVTTATRAIIGLRNASDNGAGDLTITWYAFQK